MHSSPEVPRDEMSLAEYWNAILKFAAAEGYAKCYLDGMAKLKPVSETVFAITFDGPQEVKSEAPHGRVPHAGIGWWLKHQLPILAGKDAVFA